MKIKGVWPKQVNLHALKSVSGHQPGLRSASYAGVGQGAASAAKSLTRHAIRGA